MVEGACRQRCLHAWNSAAGFYALGFGIADDWTIYWSGTYKNQAIIFRIGLKGWTADGAPIYDIRESKPIVVRSRPWEAMGLFATNDGKVVATYNYESAATDNAIECFDSNGNSLWALAVPKPPPAGHGQGPKDILATNVIEEFHVPGIGKVLGSWLWHGNNRPYLFTDDGLYVGTLLEDTHVGPTSIWGFARSLIRSRRQTDPQRGVDGAPAQHRWQPQRLEYAHWGLIARR